MTSKELLRPRYEIIADYPGNTKPIGTIILCPDDAVGTIFANLEYGANPVEELADYWCKYNDRFPHLFRKLNWWEHRKVEDMPKRLICKAISDNTEVIEIQEWDMNWLVGWIDKKARTCCDLTSFTPEYGYFPVD